jgi:hypothetical protein
MGHFPLISWGGFVSDINAGQQLQSYIVDLLLEELDVAGYLINPQCQMSSYQPYTEGWNVGCKSQFKTILICFDSNKQSTR